MANISFKSPYLPNVTLKSTDAWLLVKRTCVAATVDRVNEVNSMGYNAWLEKQLNHTSIDDSAYEAERARIFPSYNTMTDAAFFAKYPHHHPMTTSEYLQQAEFHAAWRSKRQLKQMMITFWGDQLSYDINESPHGSHDMLKAYDTHATGKFSDLLVAAFRSRALIDYLDNSANTKWGINENLGRELLELHTVGVSAGYTQDDVVNSARLLTGYRAGTVGYRTDQHMTGRVKIMGFTHANSTNTKVELQKMLDAYLVYLAKHPSTARRIADRLVERFVSDTPNPALSLRLVSIYLSAGTDMKPVLRALFTSSEFKASGGQKIRRPLDILVSMLAAGDIRPKSTTRTDLAASSAIALHNMDIYRGPVWRGNFLPHWYPAPDGYPLASKKWLSSNYMLSVWGFQHFTEGNTVDTSYGSSWGSRLGVTVNKTDVVTGVRAAALKMTGFDIPKDSALEKSLRTYVGNDPAKSTQSLPSATRVVDQYMLKRLPRAVIYSPLSIIS